jgi:hypothetical protein
MPAKAKHLRVVENSEKRPVAYTAATALPGSREHHEHGPLHRDVAGAVQGRVALILCAVES